MRRTSKVICFITALGEEQEMRVRRFTELLLQTSYAFIIFASFIFKNGIVVMMFLTEKLNIYPKCGNSVN
jgi:hypothetical protein